MRTIEQKIAEAEAHLARLKQQNRTLENGQKIILGGMLLQEARRDEKIRQWVLQTAERLINRQVDINRIQPVLDEFKAMQPITPPEST